MFTTNDPEDDAYLKDLAYKKDDKEDDNDVEQAIFEERG